MERSPAWSGSDLILVLICGIEWIGMQFWCLMPPSPLGDGNNEPGEKENEYVATS
jgi:hypothetical protein